MLMTKNRGFVPLSKEVIALIDENRDDLDRCEFIEVCINEYFESLAGENEGTKELDKGSKGEADDRVLITLSKELVELIDESRDDLSRWEFIELCIKDYSENLKNRIEVGEETKRMDETVEKLEEKTDRYVQIAGKNKEMPWKGTFEILWIGAVLSYGAGDVLSSYLAFGKAWVVEGNPVLNYLLGGNIYAFIPFKIAILLSLFLISYYYLQSKFASIFIPSMLILIGIVISIKNLLFFI